MFFSLDSHLAAWIWSYVFAVFMASPDNSNFTEMDYSKIELLIAISWGAVWLRFFYCAIFKGELI
jgi:hypothetical protein